MVPKRVDSTNHRRLPAYGFRHTMVKLYKSSIFVITETNFAIHSQVTKPTKLNGMSTMDATIMPPFQTELFSLFLPTLIWPWQSHGGSCQSSEMATLLNSLSFVFKISFLHK